jgi:hypothetical protein
MNTELDFGFPNRPEVPGNSRIKMEWDCKTG